MARRKEAHGGGHGWFVTFADLMGLLVSFFVMLVAFSNQDQKKLQIVAGSMRDAFGVQTNVRYSGDDRSRRPADPAEAEKRRAYRSARTLRRRRPRTSRIATRELGRKTEQRPGVRARRRVAAPGAAGHAGACRSVEAHHGRRDQRGTEYRDRRPGRPLDVCRKAPRSLTSAPGTSSRSSPGR